MRQTKTATLRVQSCPSSSCKLKSFRDGEIVTCTFVSGSVPSFEIVPKMRIADRFPRGRVVASIATARHVFGPTVGPPRTACHEGDSKRLGVPRGSVLRALSHVPSEFI